MIRSKASLADLQAIPIFEGIPQALLSQLAHDAALHQYDAGEILFFEGDPCEQLPLVLKGEVQLLRLNLDGREQVLARLLPFEALNLVPILLDETPVFFAQGRALSSVSLLCIPLDCLKTQLLPEPSFSQLLLKQMAGRLRNASRLATDLSLKSVRGRLASFLIRQADRRFAAYTQEEIAAEIGTVREVVARLLKDLEAKGALRRERNQVRLLDRKLLEELADE